METMSGSDTTTYWHIAHPAWTPGEPLRCRNALLADGMDVPWLWDEAPDGTDCNIVCVFPDTEQGRMEAGWLAEDRPDYTVVRVELPGEVEMTRAEWEPFPAVEGEIAAQYLTAVAEVGCR